MSDRIRSDVIGVPEERPLPYEVPFREVEHQETDDFPEDWMHRAYPLGNIRETSWYGTETDEERDAAIAELRRREAKRAELGGFGFR